ncbi:MAG: DNA polymerase III subunit delta, partial [Bacteroidales bacterium]|nr:DNA polymerase III subunit delta [Bacteroidales bacterium]
MFFADVLVPQQIKQLLINTVNQQRVSHAQLFLSQAGVHSLGLAIAYAQYLNCHNRTETDSCGVCSSCLKYKNLAHPDLHFFFPSVEKAKKENDPTSFHKDWREIVLETNALFSFDDWVAKLKVENKQAKINKNDIVRILETLMTKPYEAEYKVFIVWMAEKIDSQMANKLLKSLEEPDGKTLFILISEFPEKLLSTILSRVQLVKINKFNTEEFMSIISQKLGYTRDEALDIALLTDNNLIDAFHIDKREILEKEDFSRFVTMMRSAYRICYLTHNPAKANFPETAELIKTLAGLGREKQKSFLRYALTLVRKCILTNCGASSLVKSSSEEAAWLANFSPFINDHNGDKI